jgi:general secretion pathway protein D
MKTIITFLLAAVLTAGTFSVNAQSSGAPPNSTAPEAATVAANAPSPPAEAAPASLAIPGAPATPNVAVTNGLRLNFRGAPLESVLDYLSDAAGFIIVLDTPVNGRVDLWSDQPVTKEQAVNLLNAMLNKNGYAAVRDGRTLTIMTKDAAKTRDIPVKIGNDPNLIPNNDEMVTQIIPVRYVEAKQLTTDISPFVSSQATIVANEAGNSIVVTDTQSNIRHLLQIIEAIDNSAQGETEIRVFPLKYANPTDVATELGQIFPQNSSGTGVQTPIRFGGPGGFGGGPGGFGGGPGGFFARLAAAQSAGNQNAAVQKNSQVVAVADARTQSVIVSASKDLMDQIAGMMDQLDVPSARDTKVYVYHLDHGDPNEVAQVLQKSFGNNATQSATSSQQGALLNRQQAGATSAANNTSSFGTSTGNGTGMGGGLNTGRVP